MIEILAADAQSAPGLFKWNGPLQRRTVEEWSARHRWSVPDDLLQLWIETGGGELFETELLLQPGINRDGEDEIAAATAAFLARGLPPGMFVFHTGIRTSAVRTSDLAYVWFDGNLRPDGESRLLETWYLDLLRHEYAERYGLSAPKYDLE